MSERGVFAVDRGIWNDPDFPNEPFTEREAFLWLVGEAAWRDTKVRVGAKVIELTRGQCSFSTRFMATKFQWSEARVRRFLQRREDRGQLCTKTDAGATHITICKYDAFQRVGLPTDAGATQHRRKEETGKQTPTEPKGSSGVAASKARFPDFISAEVEKGFRDFRQRSGDPLTDRAIKLVSNQLEDIQRRGGNPNDALDMCCDRGWATVKADWYFREVAKSQQRSHSPPGGKPRELTQAERIRLKLAGTYDEDLQQPDSLRTVDADFFRRAGTH